MPARVPVKNTVKVESFKQIQQAEDKKLSSKKA